jgi:uridine kinase
MKKNEKNKLLINIFGLPGVGKSTLRNALIENLGAENCGKIPGDHYLKSKSPDDSFLDYFTHDNYDWELIEKIMSCPLGESVATPLFDYDKFIRINKNWNEKKFTMRQLNIMDTTYPCPFADLRILITLNEEERKKRVMERGRTDYFWKKFVLENWEKVEASDQKNAKNHRKKANLVLDGFDSVEENTKKAVNLIKTHFPNIEC